MAKHIGILTAGGDGPGLNAALRGVGKAALGAYGMNVIGFRDGFRGLMENRTMRLDRAALSGILTIGGTILGTSRDKPHRMPMGDQDMDMTDVIVANYHKHNLDMLVCVGGGGTQKNAFRLMQHGLNVMTLPKTIDNDVARTDVTFGYDTALGIATEAIDRLHSTAHSHHRIIVVEVMGHNTGWLALGAGVAGGADVILIPEIPYDVDKVAEAILERYRGGKAFSIVAVSEGAMSRETAVALDEANKAVAKAKKKDNEDKLAMAETHLAEVEASRVGNTVRLTQQLEQLTRLESRVTILGHLQRGGTPSAADRLLATRLGTACADLIVQGVSGVLVAARGDGTEPVPLAEVAGQRKVVPLDHPWLESARRIGTCLGD
ncbi:MAG: ATP-dependent 6-phosphofructokinase [Anaerolineae bacterium]|nr:ATP-dependent 6-phosphofructokinase [Anaerolineae bacterium]